MALATMRLLDTDVCVAFLRGTSSLVRDRLLRGRRERFALPSVVVADLYLGAEKSADPVAHIEVVEAFVDPFKIAVFGREAAREYGRIRALLERQGQPIGANDYLVAAIAVTENYTLVTGNEREFGKVPGLPIENWLKPAEK